MNTNESFTQNQFGNNFFPFTFLPIIMSNSFSSGLSQEEEEAATAIVEEEEDGDYCIVVIMTSSDDPTTESSPSCRTESLPDSLKSTAKTDDCYMEVSKPDRPPSPEEEEQQQQEDEVEYFPVDNYTDLEKSIAEMQIEKMESIKKLTVLWDTTTAKPIMTHDDLTPIMAKLGFVPLPVARFKPSFSPAPAPKHDWYNVAWMDYNFVGDDSERIRPRLPHPRIDGLHVKTYKLFVYTVGIYIGHQKAKSFFDIREIPAEETLNEEEFDFDDVFGKSYRKGSVDGMADFFSNLYRLDGSLTSEEDMIRGKDRRQE